MARLNEDPNQKVSLEDLLKLKQAERPSEEFWDRFDRQLHQRMLQTLVKKDPWYVQLARGLSGRVVQSLTVGAAAAVMAMMVVRPALVEVAPVSGDSQQLVQQDVTPVALPLPREVAMTELATDGARRDYGIEIISADANAKNAAYKREFGLDSIHVARSEADYSSDVASSWVSMSNPGVASLVY
ncbi:hypothetical protein [Coraliomargarita parva]|uniref:hypothetical protein n=1 Tax=Coraliomargarita parva TaxID=3014050 RepID=UPI0022B52BAF|nr:hypothetical protein [Coraliomargarita parva]